VDVLHGLLLDAVFETGRQQKRPFTPLLYMFLCPLGLIAWFPKECNEDDHLLVCCDAAAPCSDITCGHGYYQLSALT